MAYSNVIIKYNNGVLLSARPAPFNNDWQVPNASPTAPNVCLCTVM